MNPLAAQLIPSRALVDARGDGGRGAGDGLLGEEGRADGHRWGGAAPPVAPPPAPVRRARRRVEAERPGSVPGSARFTRGADAAEPAGWKPAPARLARRYADAERPDPAGPGPLRGRHVDLRA